MWKVKARTDLDDVVVLYSCQYGNLLANPSQHGVVNPGLTHYPGLVDELYYHLHILNVLTISQHLPHNNASTEQLVEP